MNVHACARSRQIHLEMVRNGEGGGKTRGPHKTLNLFEMREAGVPRFIGK